MNQQPFNNQTITITFGDRVENHVGMQQIGQLADCGLTIDDLNQIAEYMRDNDITYELINLSEFVADDPQINNLGLRHCIMDNPAYILIARQAADVILSKHNIFADEMFDEQVALNWDRKAKMRGKVVNKTARYNLCYANNSQEPNYEAGQGRIIAFNTLPCLQYIRDELPKMINQGDNPNDVLFNKCRDLYAEGNFYYDCNKTYIGFHGDTERKIVIATRLGASMSLHYRWYYRCNQIGQTFTIMLHHGDMYFMSDKAVGHDWKLKNTPTLRHAAGNI